MPWRHRLRLLRRGAWYALAAMLVLAALGNGVGSQLLPLAERHPERIAAWLGERAGRPVAFDHVTTQWTRRGPLLRLDNLRIGDPANPLRIGDAEVLVAQYAGLLPGRSFTELRLRGVDLTLQRSADGQWQVRGLPGQQAGGDPLEALSNLGELQLAQARLHVLAPELGIDLRLPRIDLRLRVEGERVRAGARAWLREDIQPFDIAGELDRASGDGRVYAGTRQADLAALAGTFDVAGVSPLSGRGRLRAWAQLRGHRVVAVRADAGLLDVRLRGSAAAGATAPTQALGELVLDASWAGSLQDWQLRLPRLRIGVGARRQTLDGLTLAGGERRYALRAQRVDVAPLLQLAALSDALPPSLRHWLRTTAPGAVVQDVVLAGERGGRLRAAARIDGFRFDPVGHAPGMRGVSGWLQADQDGLRLRFDRAAQVAFDWPAGFGVVHAFTLDGEAVLWRDGNGWTVRTPGLAVDGDPLRLQARGGIGFEGDGSRPHLDLAVDIGDVPISAAHGFWIHHLMPKATVQWLDTALQGGTLRNVHAVVAGDLDDWPFRNEPGMAGAGVFRADAHIADGTVKFQPDWPAAQRMDADVSFVADGFSLTGSANLGGVPVSALKAGIARFGKAELQVEAAAGGDAGNFLAMLRASPLHKEHRDILDNLRAAGPAQARVQLLLPLHHQQPPPSRIEGTVALGGVRLAEQRWKLAFEQVRGQARFDRGGFDASDLQVRQDGAPGLLSLRAGPHVRDPAHAFEATLQAASDIDALLAKAGNLDWLKPHVRGSSSWTTELAVPRGAAPGSQPARLRLRSNLVGTALDLPAPLRKPAVQALATEIEIRLPLESGEVEAALGNLLSLRSRTSNGRTGLRLQLGGGPAGAPPASGLLVGGRVEQLDALDWVGIGGGGSGNADLPLRRIELEAAHLQVLGSDVGAARLVVAPAPRGTSVQVQGTGISGALLVPTQDGATVAGRFERLHWSLPVAGKDAAPAPTPANAATTGADPAAVPPLLLDVADLRIGRTAMGRARFRSTPVAGGLRMDEFTTAGGKQRLSATGSWLGRGASARTQFKLDVASDDIGALLDGFGFGGQVAGGKGKLGAEASWRGGPGEFGLTSVEARLSTDVRDGQLLEIEPGAGRVLGLLGVAQLRRRLTLDFSDFFSKGFAFDRIQGDATLAQGQLRTEDLAVRGPAAEIHVRGSTDLRNRRFDQTVEVRPKSGSLLTAVGALAGGPVGAAVGAVANAVLDKPMRGIGAKTYRVTGPWAEPKVEAIARDNATQAAAGRPPGD
ncbi:YhdP family protein [Thermomonas sp. XSG]|uniref:YhdP family protein n=1 Tax=Thermomonas sp. XSG TaxID=2771436 RepID=UPI001CC1D91E|nr:YhdP family protein [Thermomonas sp. XSG]